MSTIRRGGLGKGLGALIPTSGSTSSGAAFDALIGDGDREKAGKVAGATFEEIPTGEITPNAKQPRQHFDEAALAELKTSIEAFGLLQPIVVRRVAGDGYELVMGERRWRAATELGLATIPAIVRETADDAMLRDALLENLHRQQLNPLEEAAAYQQLLEEFGTTHDELATRIGRSRSQVTNTIRLLNLPVAVQRRVAAGVLSAGHARALLSASDPDLQDELAGRIVAEGLSVRATEELVSLGKAEQKKTRIRGPRPTAPALAGLSEQLSDVFDTRVTVDLGRRKGKVVIEFASIDDLERIVALMSPEVSSVRHQVPASAVSTVDSEAAEAAPVAEDESAPGHEDAAIREQVEAELSRPESAEQSVAHTA